jgi:ribosome-binding factor A
MRHQKKPAGRAVRVAEQIQKDLAGFIARELRDPRLGFVTLTEVALTPDYAYATVYFSVLTGNPDDSEKVLNDSAGFLRNLLFKQIRIHTVPTLRFKHDPSVERGAHMAGLIHDALNPDASSTVKASSALGGANPDDAPNA